MKIVVFKVNDEEYGMDIGNVVSVEKNPEITYIPNADKNIIGIAVIRNEVVPIYDLRRKFGLDPNGYPDNARTIIVNINIKDKKSNVGIKVDHVIEIMEVNDFMTVPGEVKNSDNRFIANIINTEKKGKKRTIMLIDEKTLLENVEL